MSKTDPPVLLVEDDADDQVFIQRSLKRCGVGRVEAVGDGTEATAYLLGEGRFSNRAEYPLPWLIITDIKMPKMGGIDLLAWIQQRSAEFGNIPAVVLTSSSDQADIAAAYRHGARGYMIKPVHFGELENMIRIIEEYWHTSRVPGSPANGE